MTVHRLPPFRGSPKVTPTELPVVKPGQPSAAPRPPLESKRAPVLQLDPREVGPAPTASRGLSCVVEHFEGTHHADGTRTPRDAQYQVEQRIRVPKRADFAIDGLSKLEAAGAQRLYDAEVSITRPDGTTATINLMRAANDSVPVDDFYLALEAILAKHTFDLDASHATALGLTMPAGATTVPLTGAAVLAAIDATIAEAVKLADSPSPEAAPIPNETPAVRAHFLTMLKRFAIQAVFHSRDLTTVHVAMGHDPKQSKPLDETMRHDLVESAPLADLAWQLERRPHDPWMDAWLRTEVRRQAPKLLDGLSADPKALYALVQQHPELSFNCSALNPHNLVAMFRWGDSREDCNVLIDPHRLSPHHNGSSTTDIDFQQRAINFLSHHMPREHMGVRHEQRGDWDSKDAAGRLVPFGKLEHAFKTDHAITGSTVLQAIAREGARFYRAAEEQGFTVPWQKLAVPGAVEFVQLDSAYQTLQSTNRVADDLWATQQRLAIEALGKATPKAAAEGRRLLESLTSLSSSSSSPQVELVTAGFATFTASVTEAADRPLVTALGLAAVARLTQLSPASAETVERFVAAAEVVEDTLYAFEPTLAPKEGRLFIGLDTALGLRRQLEQLSVAATEARAANDGSTSLVYERWQQVLTGGFASLAH